METLKPLVDLTRPDDRASYWAVVDGSGGVRQSTIQDVYDLVLSAHLHDSVPEAIRTHFSQAQNLAAYSWFHYPFNVTAQFLGFVTVEFALKSRLGRRASFKRLIEIAVNEGLVRDEGFSNVESRSGKFDSSYVHTLIEVMPRLRNDLAHGTAMLHNQGLASLKICADFINQLFPSQGAANSSLKQDSAR